MKGVSHHAHTGVKCHQHLVTLSKDHKHRQRSFFLIDTLSQLHSWWTIYVSIFEIMHILDKLKQGNTTLCNKSYFMVSKHSSVFHIFFPEDKFDYVKGQNRNSGF